MNIENFELWMQDLESGKYLQYDGSLTGFVEQGDERVEAFCCLGVGCLRLDGLPLDSGLRVDWRRDALAPAEFIKWLDLPLMAWESPGWVGTTWDEIGEEATFDIGPNPNEGSWSAASLNDQGKPFIEIAARLRARRDELVAYIP